MLDATWGEDKPAPPDSAFRVHPPECAGSTTEEKLGAIREKMEERGAKAAVFAMLDEVAYVLNLRGADIECCPVCISYLIVTSSGATLYCDADKVASIDVIEHLREANVCVQPYESVLSDLRSIVDGDEEGKVWVDPTKASHGIARVVPSVSVNESRHDEVGERQHNCILTLTPSMLVLGSSGGGSEPGGADEGRQERGGGKSL